MVKHKQDYLLTPLKEAINSVLLELFSILGEFNENMVVVGGLVPYLLLSNPKDPHVGTTDIDVAIDHRKISSESYRTIKRLLLEHGYKEGKQEFIFTRTIRVQEKYIEVEIDFLAGEYEGRGRKRRHQHIQDLKARKARGCDLAFSDYEVRTIHGKYPNGGFDSKVIKIASIVPFLVMKAQALNTRLKNKDAYDIYYCIKYYPDGVQVLSAEFKKCAGNKLVNEAIKIIKAKFSSMDSAGPAQVANFEGVTEGEDRDLIMREVYEYIQRFIMLVEKAEQ